MTKRVKVCFQPDDSGIPTLIVLPLDVVKNTFGITVGTVWGKKKEMTSRLWGRKKKVFIQLRVVALPCSWREASQVVK